MTIAAAGASALSCTDWRGWSSHHVAPLLQREADRWVREFHWDQRWSFTHVEAAREAGRLPGLVATTPDGVTHGWTYFLRRANQFQIGTIVSNRADVTRTLVDQAMTSPLAEQASVVVFSPEAPGLEDALHAHDVRTEPYDYLVKERPSAAAESSGAGSCRSFEPTDLVSVAALVGDAYRHAEFVRPFVPNGEPREWREYVGQLVETRGCGEFLAGASPVIDDEEQAGALKGALIATRLSHDTGHIAQIIVSSRTRGTGLARRMLSHTLGAMHAQGLDRVSLLVARTNTAARGLYSASGFQPTATFIAGIRS